MKPRLPNAALLLALLIPFASLAVHPAAAQTRAISSSGTSTSGGGKLDITIETFGTFVGIQTDCSIETIVVSVPIPYPANCQIMTQAIHDSLTVHLAGIFAVYQNLSLCTVYFYRNVDPECTYFDTKIDGDWRGMNFTIVDPPTPTRATTWGLLKAQEWRSALRGDFVTPRRTRLPVGSSR